VFSKIQENKSTISELQNRLIKQKKNKKNNILSKKIGVTVGFASKLFDGLGIKKDENKESEWYKELARLENKVQCFFF